MPFTLAHPAAVLPLMRRPFDGLALVCGAMAPDIPYYIRSTSLPVTAQSWYEPFTNATTSHSIAGLLPVALPLALVIYLMLLAAAPPLVWLARGEWDLSAMHTSRAAPHWAGGGARRGRAGWAWVPVSLLIGVLTHLVWDSFTSSNGFLASRLDFLNEPVWADLTWVRLMQHGSTMAGLAIIVVALWHWHRVLLSRDAAPRRRAFWVIGGFGGLGLVAGVVAVLATFKSSVQLSTRELVENVLATGIMGGGAAVGIAVAMATAGWWFVLLRSTRSTVSR